MTETALPLTPDYDAWPIEAHILTVESSPRQVSVRWSDGRVSRYHSIWLRENAADETTVNPATRERILDLSTLPAWPEIGSVGIDDSGALCIDFVPEDRRLRFHPGWLRAHDYDNATDAEAALVQVTTWLGGPDEQPDSRDASGLLDSAPGRTAALPHTPDGPPPGLSPRAGYRLSRRRRTPRLRTPRSPTTLPHGPPAFPRRRLQPDVSAARPRPGAGSRVPAALL